MVTSASLQISDSWTSPPVAKMPTTVQSLSRNAIREPTPRPANCRAAFRPTITSRTPRWNGPPLHDLELVPDGEGRRAGRRGRGRCWARSRPAGAGRPSPPAPPTRAAAPRASRAMPGSVLSRMAASRGTPLDSSASDPARSRITRSGRPVLASVWRKPSDIARTETSTPTTPAMPDHHDQRGPQPLRQGAQVHQRDLEDLVERAHRPALSGARRGRPRSGARCARSAGGSPIASAQRQHDERAQQPRLGRHVERREAGADGAVEPREDGGGDQHAEPARRGPGAGAPRPARARSPCRPRSRASSGSPAPGSARGPTGPWCCRS